MKTFYGASIERASSTEGKSYSQLPNAFRYRTELVPNCSCNAKSAVGLASISLEQDKTLRNSDLVVGEGGLLIVSGSRGDSDLSFRESLASMRRRPLSFEKE
jgi:hypothetical protein